jgi:hypothetical protein
MLKIKTGAETIIPVHSISFISTKAKSVLIPLNPLALCMGNTYYIKICIGLLPNKNDKASYKYK